MPQNNPQTTLNQPILEFKCPYCGSSYDGEDQIKEHMKVCKNSQTTPNTWHCPKCESRYVAPDGKGSVEFKDGIIRQLNYIVCNNCKSRMVPL